MDPVDIRHDESHCFSQWDCCDKTMGDISHVEHGVDGGIAKCVVCLVPLRKNSNKQIQNNPTILRFMRETFAI